MVRQRLTVQLLVLGLAAWTASAADPEFRDLLAKGDLTGWHGDNPHTTNKATPETRDQVLQSQQADFLKHWKVEGDELVNDGHGPYATTAEEYGDIEFKVEYKTVPLADSGIYLRGTPQVQIWDTTEAGGKKDLNAHLGSGGLFNNKPNSPGQSALVHADKPFGKWNQFRILQVGSRTSVYLNDKLVVDKTIMENFWNRAEPLPARGPIHLQTHGGEIRWRNLLIRDIQTDEANTWLRGDDAADGYVSIFNGKDLAGWAGATDDYQVIDDAITCKSGKGGVLFTEEQYSDFSVRLEFMTPPGGNNGLAIRYPGQGRAAYDAMTELQVIDFDDKRYADANLDPRQAHGSAYGMVAGKRGYQRPPGEWNYQETTVVGSTIRVELNGTVILDCDLAKVTEFLADKEHPGKDLKKGHFGFAGHNDPVKFRRIAIRKL